MTRAGKKGGRVGLGDGKWGGRGRGKKIRGESKIRGSG